MKILFIHHSGLLGGAGLSLLNVAETLRQNGHEVALCIPSEPDDMIKLATERKMSVQVCERRIGAITYVSGIDKAFSPRFLYRFALIIAQFGKWNRRIRDFEPDVVVVNSKTLCWMSLLPQIKKRKSICFVRETIRGNRSNILNRSIASLLDRFSVVTFISEYDKHVENLHKARTQTIYNYVNNMQAPPDAVLEAATQKWGLSEERFKVLYVGGVNSMKGFHIAVQAVLNSGRDIELIVAGSDFDSIKKTGNKDAVKYVDSMQKYLEEKDKYHQIHVIGKQTDMSVCYSLCDVLLFPMQSAHQARPVFEAGYFGKTVVISDFENIREFVHDGKNGFTATATDAEEFSQRLRQLQQNASLRNEMGNCNKYYTMTRHSKDVVQDQIVSLISEV